MPYQPPINPDDLAAVPLFRQVIAESALHRAGYAFEALVIADDLAGTIPAHDLVLAVLGRIAEIRADRELAAAVLALDGIVNDTAPDLPALLNSSGAAE